MAARNTVETHVFEDHVRIQIEADWPLEQTQERHPPAVREGVQTLAEGGRIARHLEQHIHPIAVGLRTHGLDDVHLQRVEDPCRAHARGELTPQSDVDLLIEFEPGKAPSLWAEPEMREAFGALFGGRRVDLVPPQVMENPYRRKSILRDLRVLYEA